MEILLFVSGLIFLLAGAEALVRGASRLAASIGISPLIIGLTVVAFGTSSPELAVSVKAAVSDQAGIAVGNVIGSNILNVLFILGLSSIIVPLIVSQQLIRIDVPVMIGISILLLILSLDRNFSRIDGMILVAGLIGYVSFQIIKGLKEKVPAEFAGEFGGKESSAGGILRNIVLAAIGLVMLVMGSNWLVDSSVVFARYLGVSEIVIGLTVVSAGTSLPEVVTSIVAAIRGERDIAVGNVVGSNIFNILGVLGLASLIAPSGIDIQPSIIRFDLPVMVAVAFVCLPVFFVDGVIRRWEGFLMFGYYIAYTLYLILDAAQHDALQDFGTAMVYFVFPLTFVTMIVIYMIEIRNNNKGMKKRDSLSL